MYFGAIVAGEAHLWRQRFPDGRPEQLTFGPTEEEGLAVAPDGAALITSIGFSQRALWIHDRDGDRAFSSQGDASQPWISGDGHRLYYLVRPQHASPTNELWVSDWFTGASQLLLTDFSISAYDISPDETEVAFATTERGSVSDLWVARLDRRTAPVRLPVSGETPFFGPNGEIVFKATEGRRN